MKTSDRKMYSILLICAVGALIIGSLSLISCSTNSKRNENSVLASAEWESIYSGVSRTPAASDGSNPDLEPTKYLEQGWTPEVRELSYRTAQGSHIMPLKFALAMERADSKDAFFGNRNLSGYGFVLQKGGPMNPYGLPVGFTVDGPMRFKKTLGVDILTGSSEWDVSKPRMLGVNCSLCHTTNIHYRGQAIRIDGGQTLAHFQKFIRDMDNALRVNFEDKAKLERFLNRVVKNQLPNEPHVTDRAQLVKDLEAAVRVRGDWSNLNHDGIVYGHGFNETDMAHGPGRIDAFAAIFNEVLARDLGDPSNAGPTDAPVSIPVIWDSPYHDKVQWNGLAFNDVNNGGPLARNLGQVLGVFGKVWPQEQKTLAFGKGLQGYCSTIRRRGLDALEGWLNQLWAPAWPEDALGRLDQAKVAQGRKIYEQKCLGCHADYTWKGRTEADLGKFKVRMVPMAEIGTETKFNDNALSRVAKTHFLKDRLTRVKEGRPLEEREPGATVLKHVVAGSIAGSISVESCGNSVDVDGGKVAERLLFIAKKAFSSKEAKRDDLYINWEEFANLPTAQKKKVLNEKLKTVWPEGLEKNANEQLVKISQYDLSKITKEELDGLLAKARVGALAGELAAYKARPLNGIWASPPFLHNGSVNSLYDLLLPPDQRGNFFLGCDEFDPVNVGLACSASNGGFLFDTSLVGNRPVGHDYGPKGPNAEEERRALVEYLKSI